MAEPAGKAKAPADELRAAIERLLASKREGVQQHREYGHALGAAWAQRSASYHQLRRLRNMREACGAGDFEALLARDPHGQFYGIVGSRGFREHQAPLEFWCEILEPGDRLLQADADFVGGFAAGADGLFKQIDACL